MGGAVSKYLVSVWVAALMLVLGVPAATAAGLGKLTVISALGQPFRGEIDLVSVKKEEQSSLNVRMAAPDAFKQADLPYTAYVSNLKLSIEKRPSGEQFIKVSAFQPLNEPFIDFLVELSWSSGRLVRAYTALVDPPSVGDAAAKAPTATPAPPSRAAEAVPPVGIEPQPAGPEAGAIEDSGMQGADVEPSLAAAPKGVEAGGIEVPEPAVQAGGGKQAAAGAAGAYTVRKGDTLGRIALANKPAEVSLDQMLVALFRENPEAFAGRNMNRLKTGKVLRIPGAGEADDVAVSEARREVRAQATNWNAYRGKLAALAGEAQPPADLPSQSASGKVASGAQTTTPMPPEAPKEVLKLSKGESGKTVRGNDATGSADRVRALEEEVAAKNRALGESKQRIAALEKTVKDMQTLMEMKSQGMSGAQTAAEAAKASTPAPKAPKPEPPTAEPPAASSPAPAQTPGESAVPPAPEAPAAAAPAPKPPKPVAPPPPPSLVDEVLGNPLYLAGGAAVLLGIAGLGYLGYKRRRDGLAPAGQGLGLGFEKKNPSEPLTPEESAAATAAGAALAADLPEEGDPLHEAEIFLTYGRDTLAEERLKEAIATNPKRFELHAKLLEIYAGRKDAGAFEQVAKELQIGTGGQGEIWGKAARLGYQVDPTNPRYAAGRPAEDDGTATMVLGAGGLAAAAAAAAPEAAVQPPAYDPAKSNLDFNLGFDDRALGTTTDIDLGKLGPEIDAAASTPTDIDLSAISEAVSLAENAAFGQGAGLPDAGGATAEPLRAVEPTRPLDDASAGGIDFDFDMDAPAAAPPPPVPVADDASLNFDLSGLDLGPGPAATAAGVPPDFDLSGINLDLGGASLAPSGGEGRDDKWYDVQTKFDLAKAYQEMGDREGAREILQEVIAEGDAEQKQAAQQVLSSLA